MSRRHERGQILPIAAVAFLVLIGIAGLVIDVGMTWILLRREQAAVDVGSIAAARFIPDGNVGAMEEAACFYAQRNDFFKGATTNDLSPNGCVPANDTFGSVLTVNYPPASGDYAGVDGYVEVILNGAHQTFFSRVFGVNTMGASADAVSANVETSGGGGQLVALDPTTCGSGAVSGNGAVDVENSVYVNSDGSTARAAEYEVDGITVAIDALAPCPGTTATFDDACSGSSGAFMFNGNNAILNTEQVSVRGICGENSNPFPGYCTAPCNMSEGAPQIEDPFDLVVPTRTWAGTPLPGLSEKTGSLSLADCDDVDDTGCNFGNGSCGDWCEIHPGVYYGGWQITKPVCLHEGFYYLAGGGIQVSGNAGRIVALAPGETCLSVWNDSTAGGDGRILLYGTDGPNCPTSPTTGDRRCQGTISIAGQGGFQAKGYEKTNTVVRNGITDEDYHRLLIWQGQYQEDGASRTAFTYPNDSLFMNDMVHIAGQGYLNFYGTIYAPRSLVNIKGQGAGTGNVAGVQILAWRFEIAGNAGLDMPYLADELSPILAKGLVQ